MPRFFIDLPLTCGDHLAAPRELAHHAIRALRIRSGSAITLFNGAGGEFSAVLEYDDPKSASLHVGQFHPIERELPFRIVVAQGVASGDKMDWMVEKAVEMGAAGIQPLLTARCVVKLEGDRALRRVSHWHSLCHAASEQCGRNRIAEVRPIVSLGDWLASAGNAHGRLNLVLSPEASLALEDVAAPAVDQSVALLIGPEGGLDARELEQARELGFLAVSLGPRVLRAETAAVAALATLGAVWRRPAAATT